MKKNYWIILFVIVFLADLSAVYAGDETPRYITKPWLMPLLMISFLYATKSRFSLSKRWMLAALAFSWSGDVLLMLESVNSSFFILGLVSFLLAHICYILFYEKILLIENIKKNYWLFLPVILYYLVLIYFLSPYLGEMNLPVRVYGIVISCMLAFALQTGKIKNQSAAIRMIAGALLFIISDTLLAFNKFYNPFEYAGLLIMFSYGIAQLLIVLGSVQFIISSSK